MVGRIVPRNPADSGWLYLGLRMEHAQLQFKAASSGSVVDHTYPPDMKAVVIPPAKLVDGKKVAELWDRFRRAKEREDVATGRIDAALEQFAAGGGGQVSRRQSATRRSTGGEMPISPPFRR